MPKNVHRSKNGQALSKTINFIVEISFFPNRSKICYELYIYFTICSWASRNCPACNAL